MKTHMLNTQAQKLANDIVNHAQFASHQKALHSKIKPEVVTRRKQDIKIQRNNKKELNINPDQHVRLLEKNLKTKKFQSTIDNKEPEYHKVGLKINDQKIKKNKHEKFIHDEHMKHFESMKNRIKTCKNLNNRKKDKTDPIVNPAYFIRDNAATQAVSIDGYCRKILQKNRPQSAAKAKKQSYQFVMGSTSAQNFQPQKSVQGFGGGIPNYSTHSKNRPMSAQPAKKGQLNCQKPTGMKDDLPECQFKAILEHIINNKIYKDTDIKVLYVRLCYKYGEQDVDEVWDKLMDELQR